MNIKDIPNEIFREIGRQDVNVLESMSQGLPFLQQYLMEEYEELFHIQYPTIESAVLAHNISAISHHLREGHILRIIPEGTLDGSEESYETFVFLLSQLSSGREYFVCNHLKRLLLRPITNKIKVSISIGKKIVDLALSYDNVNTLLDSLIPYPLINGIEATNITLLSYTLDKYGDQIIKSRVLDNVKILAEQLTYQLKQDENLRSYSDMLSLLNVLAEKYNYPWPLKSFIEILEKDK
jgi:hypothetical protein